MKTGAVLLPMLLAPCVGGSTQPPGMYQPATIRITDSQLCFSVADSDETRRTPPILAAISVSEHLGSEWKKQWSWTTPLAPETILRPEDCIPYGYRPIDDPQDYPLQPFRPGGRYHVSINSEIPNPARRGDRMVGRMYNVDFCVVRAAAGEVEAVIVPSSRGVTQWQVCDQQNRSRKGL